MATAPDYYATDELWGSEVVLSCWLLGEHVSTARYWADQYELGERVHEALDVQNPGSCEACA